MIKIICPLCKSQISGKYKQLYKSPEIRKEYKLYHCSSCDLEFWYPLEMPPANYYEQRDSYKELHNGWSTEIKWRHKIFYNRFSKRELKGKILDIGCGDGRLLKVMKDDGWEVYGIDFDKYSVNVARNRCGKDNIYCGTLDEYLKNRKQELKFDIITFFEVLEHQTNPNRFIDKVKLLLDENGIIAGSVPNRDRFIMQKRIGQDLPPHHFTLWSKELLNYFFTKNGFCKPQFIHTRYEPHLLLQVVENIIYNNKMELHWNKKNNNSKSNISFMLNLKRKLVNPIIKVISIVEYPILFLTKKSISIYFETHY